jgi:dTMP kinase
VFVPDATIKSATSLKSKGYFLTFEGGEGVGKSSLLQAVAQWLTQEGIAHVVTGEPGGTIRGQELRRWLQASKWPSVAEFLLYSADRSLHVEEVVRPALAKGMWVLCDRFVDSSRIYQGEVGGLDRAFIEVVSNQCTGGLTPDLTFLLDCEVDVSMGRLVGREHLSHYDQAKRGFHEKVRAGFLALAALNPDRIVVLDSTAPLAELVTHVKAASKGRF